MVGQVLAQFEHYRLELFGRDFAAAVRVEELERLAQVFLLRRLLLFGYKIVWPKLAQKSVINTS